MVGDFELGICNLLRSNINYLHQSFQILGKNVQNVESGEFVWTDGESVWLSPVNSKGNDGETIFTSKSERFLVGKFENFVFGISCSVLTEGSRGYFIAIVLKEKVVVLWRTIGETVVKVAKEYSNACLAQGCVWHPTLPLLAVLSKTSAVLLGFSEEFECNVISIQTSHRDLKACAWSKDGKSLASAVEDSLCIFSWTDLTKPNNFTFAHWNSLEVTGKINCIAPWQTSSFIIVTELPLDKLCGNCKFENDTDVFEVQNGSDSSEEDKGKESNSSAVLTQDTNLSILTPSADQDLNSLLKLKLRTPQFETSETLAQIIAICCEDLKPREVGRSSIKGLLSPDLLLFQPATSTVIVGSHCCSRIDFFTLHQSNVNGKAEFVTSNNLLELDPATKPKGMCLIPGHTNSFLALLGKAKDSSNVMVFPPSAICGQYEVSLSCLNVIMDDDHREKVGQRISQEDVVTLTNGRIVSCAVVANSEHSPSLRLPDGSIFKGCVEASGSNKTSLISELTLNEVPEMLGDYSKNGLQGAQSISFKHIQDMAEATMATFVSQVNDRLSMLEKRMDKFGPNSFVENKHSPYPSPENAEFVCVVWTDELTGAVEQENFLLDKGRLKLKTIQQAFSASLVRMCIGDVPCIVSSGEGGFIPVRFLTGSTIHMSGHSKL